MSHDQKDPSVDPASVCAVTLRSLRSKRYASGQQPAEPDPHDGVFTSEYGTMTFNGDGESVTFDFSRELAEAAGLPGGEQSGTYVFLFQHGQWRYDKAERFRIAVSDVSYDFINDFTVTDGNTIALQSPLNGEETILFIKGENEQ